MKKFIIIAILTAGIVQLSVGQGPGTWNPFLNAVDLTPNSSGTLAEGIYACGDPVDVSFNIGQSTNNRWMPGSPSNPDALNATNRLEVDICIVGYIFDGTVVVGGNASSFISGTYASFFTWQFTSTTCVRGTQAQAIPRFNIATGAGSGSISVDMRVPITNTCTGCLNVNVSLGIPIYITETGGQTSDNIVTTNSSVWCRSLPIQLFQLNSLSKKTSGLNVEWKTLNESNTDYFEVYRMYEGNQSTWMKVGKVDAAGESHKELTYTYTDNSYAKAQKIYYRIKQVDQSGSSTYTDIKGIELKENSKVQISGFPNPIRTIYHVAFNSPSDAPIQIEVIDLLGRIAFKQKVSAVKGYNQYDLEMKDVAAGTYFVKVYGKEINQSLTVVKTE